MRTKLRIVVNILVFIAFMIGAYWAYQRLTAAPPEVAYKSGDEQAASLVQVEEIRPRPLTVTVSAIATVESSKAGTINAEVSGRITDIEPQFTIGETVQDGAVLATIEASEYESNLRQARSSLEAAKTQLSQEEAQAEVARAELSRMGRSVESNPLAARVPQVESARSNLAAAESALAIAQQRLDKTTIRAPFAGEISAKSISLGQQVMAGASIGSLFANDQKRLRVDVPASTLTLLRSHSLTRQTPIQGRLTIKTDDGRPQIITATVTELTNQVNSQSQLVSLYLQVDSAAIATLPVGSIEPIILYPSKPKPVVSLPIRAVGQDNYVRLLTGDEGRTLASAKIEPGWWGEERVIIDNGLENGDTVVVTPLASTVLDGMTVRLERDPISTRSVTNASDDVVPTTEDSIRTQTSTTSEIARQRESAQSGAPDGS